MVATFNYDWVEQAQRLLARTGGIPAVMASPPTMALSAASAATSIAGTVQTILNTADKFNYLGSVPAVQLVGASPWNGGAAQNLYLPGSVTRSGSSKIGTKMDVEFMFDGDEIELLVFRSATTTLTSVYQIYVDGQAVGSSFVDEGAGSSFFRKKLTFASAAPRSIRLRLSQNMRFGGVTISNKYSIWPTKRDPFKIMFTGDSYTEGVGGTHYINGLACQAGDFLGVPDAYVNGEAGIGTISVGGQSSKTVIQKIADVTDVAPNWHVVMVGCNDRIGGPATPTPTLASLQAAISTYANLLLSSLPNTPVTWIGAWRAPGLTTGQDTYDAIKAVIQALPGYGTQVYYVDTYAENWQFGTGRVGATTGDGNSDIYTSSDNVHPLLAGHTYHAQRVAEGVRAHGRLLAAA